MSSGSFEALVRREWVIGAAYYQCAGQIPVGGIRVPPPSAVYENAYMKEMGARRGWRGSCLY